MRLFGKPGGTRQDAQAALLLLPFDLSLMVIVQIVSEEGIFVQPYLKPIGGLF